MIPSLQQSSLLVGKWHFAAGLQRGSGGHTGHGGGHAGGGHAGAHAGGWHAGAQAGAHAGGGQAGAHAGGGHTGLQVGGGGHTGLHGAGQAGCSHTLGHASHEDELSQALLPEHPPHRRAVVHKKTNEVINPSCFFI